MLPLTLTSNNYVFGKDTLKAVNASASKDKYGVTHISLVNADANKVQEIAITLNGANYQSVSGRILKADKMQDYNSFENPDNIVPVVFSEVKLNGNKLTIKMPAASVVVLELK